jgi:hypothetical protein
MAVERTVQYLNYAQLVNVQNTAQHNHIIPFHFLQLLHKINKNIIHTVEVEAEVIPIIVLLQDCIHANTMVPTVNKTDSSLDHIKICITDDETYILTTQNRIQVLILTRTYIPK